MPKNRTGTNQVTHCVQPSKLVPMLWMIVPFVLVVAQLQHYGYGGQEAGQPVLLKVQLSDAWGNGTGAGRPDLCLETPACE